MNSLFSSLWRMRATVMLVLLMAAFLGLGQAGPTYVNVCDDDLEINEATYICIDEIFGPDASRWWILKKDDEVINDPDPFRSDPLRASGPPLVFEPNLGQADPRYQFVARARSMGVLLDQGNAVLALDRGRGRPPSYLHAVLDGAAPQAEAVPEEALPSRSNYFYGSDPDNWITNVPSSSRVRYRNVYPGIDIVYYGSDSRLEHDFVVHPGADARHIRMKFNGADSIDVDNDGNARISLDGREVVWRKPVLYQTVNHRRIPIEGRYRREADVLSFEIGRFNPDRPLIIDPVVEFTTFLGGGQSDAGSRIAADSQGNVYTTGLTFEFNFPTAKRFGGFTRGSSTIFVTKSAANGSAPVFQTYIGGLRTDGATGIALDSQNNVYIAGGTRSTDYPVTTGVLKSRFNPPGLTRPDLLDCVVTKLNPAGDALVYSTYLGGTSEDGCAGIAVDAQGNAAVTGYTASSADFPTTASAPQRNLAGRSDVFIAKLNATGTSLLYSTLLGGQDADLATSIALDAQGAAYVTGSTASVNNFPVTQGAAQTRFGGVSAGTDVRFGDGFVAKLNPAGSAFQYVTFLGGSHEDIAMNAAIDASGNAYVTGFTRSPNFPTTSGAYRTTYSGAGGNIFMPGGDAFAAKLNPTGSALVYSTYLGGARDDWGAAIAVDSSGNAWVGGATLSTDFPTTADAGQRTFGGANPATKFPLGDGFVAQLNGNGSALVYSTYLGGSGDEFVFGVAAGASGSVYVTGSTLSPNFPVTPGAMQTAYGGWEPSFLPLGDAFITKYGGGGTGSFISSVSSAASYAGGGVAPGEIVVLTGGGIGPPRITTLALTPSGTVSTLLAETRVTFDNIAAPLVYVLSGQTSVIVPYELAGKQNTQMVAEYRGVRSLPVTVPVLQTKPALFTANASGRGQGAILNADYSYNSASNPVDKGGIVLLYGTGEGPIDPPGVTGGVSNTVVPRIVLPVVVTIGGQNANVLYKGAAPGQVAGLFQMNVEVPGTAASGAQEVVVSIGNTRSQSGVTVAVR